MQMSSCDGASDGASRARPRSPLRSAASDRSKRARCELSDQDLIPELSAQDWLPAAKAAGICSDAEEITTHLEPEMTLPEGLSAKQAERIQAGAVDCTICLQSVPVNLERGVPIWKLCRNCHFSCDACMKGLRERGNAECPLCRGSEEFKVDPVTRGESHYLKLIAAFLTYHCPKCDTMGFETIDDVKKHLEQECCEVNRTFFDLDMEEILTAKQCSEKLAETPADSLKRLAKALAARTKQLEEALARIKMLEALEKECKEDDARLAKAVPIDMFNNYVWKALLCGKPRLPGKHKNLMNTAANTTDCQVNGHHPLFAFLRQPCAHENEREKVLSCYLLGPQFPDDRKKDNRRQVLCAYLENSANGLEVRLTSLGVHDAEILRYVVPGDVPHEGAQLLLYELRIKIKQLLAKGRVNEHDKNRYSAFRHLWAPAPPLVVLDDDDDAAAAGAAQD